MNTMLLIGTLIVLPTADLKTSSTLFGALDRDDNGLVEAAELNSSQQSFFRRALRVADRNEDGALTKDELSQAIADPVRVNTLPQARNRTGFPPNFDPAEFDINRDGKLAKEELPAYMRSRFNRLYDRFGTSSIAIDDLKRIMSYSQTDRSTKSGPDTRMSMERKDEPSMKSRTQSRMGQQMTGVKPGELFSRLDRNGDGRLTGTEVPQRLRTAVRKYDSDQNREITVKEFSTMILNMRRPGNRTRE